MPHPARARLIRLCRRAADLAGLDAGSDWELTILFTGDRVMTRANRELLGHVGTTDVITMAYTDEADGCFDNEVGVELIVCADYAKREGDEREDSDYSSEIVLYVVHGLLHAAGYDDLTAAKAARMREAERRVMTALRREFDFSAVFPPPAGAARA